MSKRLIVVLALLFVVGTTFAAYAEVQNVKVSGDINFLGVARNNFNLGTLTGTGTNTKNYTRFFATQARLRVDADLTDNVMATVRLINERDWTGETANNTEIQLDLAYVTLKEFLYSPLTLTVGRQEIRFGNTFIIGNSHTATTANSSFPIDLTEKKAFDGIRATLNYDPLVIDAVYAKLSHTNISTDDNRDLFGVNASYDVTKDLNVQAYAWNLKDKSAAVSNNKKDNIYTVGGLVTAKLIEDLKASLEAAYQFGGARNDSIESNRSGYAVQAMLDYTFSKVKFTPSIGGSYTLLSGTRKNKNGTGWNQMFYDQRLGNIAYAILPFTNLQAINLRGSMKPMDDVTILANFANFRFMERVDGGTMTEPDGTIVNITPHRKDIGNELDLTALYDYTEDVQLGLTWGYFACGKAIASSRGDASQLIASMKVTF